MSRTDPSPHTATFVLSTGRCGTQWIASALGETFPHLLHVTHEPIDNGYEPRAARAAKTVPPVVADHLERIEAILEKQSYLECTLLEFLNLPTVTGNMAPHGEVVDRFRYLSGVWTEWQAILRHPCALEIAEELGYVFDEIDESALRRR
jgi:hypothetical protein